MALAGAQPDLPKPSQVDKTSQKTAGKIDDVPDTTLVKKKKEKAAENSSEKEESSPGEETEKVTTHVIEKGDTLGKISEKTYGRTRYWRILKLYNKCDPGKLKVRQIIKAPDLTWLLEECGLQAKYPEVAEGMLKIKGTMIMLEDKRPERNFTDGELKEIDELGTLVGKMQAQLEHKVKGVKRPPYATLKQLRTCRTYLNRIAARKKSGKLNLHSLAHEHLSNAMVYAVLWAEAGFK